MDTKQQNNRMIAILTLIDVYTFSKKNLQKRLHLAAYRSFGNQPLEADPSWYISEIKKCNEKINWLRERFKKML